MDSKNEVIIIGAGVAGSSLAYTLAKDGRYVLLIERNLNEPNTIAGELLQPAGYLKLKELGLDDCVRDIDAQYVLGYVAYKDGKSVRMPFPLENYSRDVGGRSFHHGRFVRRLREKAASLHNVKLEQGTATSLIEERGVIKGVQYKTSIGQEITAYAPLTVFCDGRFSRFRKFLAKSKIDTPSHFAGLVLKNCQLPHQRYVHLVLGNPSALVFYPLSSTEVRCTIDFPGHELPSIPNGQMARFLKTVIAPQVPIELMDAFISSVEEGDIRVMPVSCMSAEPSLIPGAVLVGDALNMRHAITGGGMTVALTDITHFRDLIRPLDLNDRAKTTEFISNFYNIRKPKAFCINVIADTVHKLIFCTSPELCKKIQEACLKYMSQTNGYPRAIVELISGLNPNPWLLVLHLAVAAFFAAGYMMLPVPSFQRLYYTARYILVSVAIFLSILMKEDIVQVFFATNKRS